MSRLDQRPAPAGPPVAAGPSLQHEVVLPTGSRAHRLVTAACADLAPVGLQELNAAAELLTRVDTKYLVPLDAFAPFVSALESRVRDASSGGTGLAVLDIAGARAFDYESVYFDTEDFALFRHHVQGRRRRYKVRTRTYLSSGLCMLEVKLKGARGETVKERRPHPFQDRARLGEDGRRFVAELLRARYGLEPLPLAPRLTTLYRRTTLVDLRAGERVTCDTDLVCGDSSRSARADVHVVVETKSEGGRGPADRVLRGLGLRPVRVSKYCTAVALLNPRLPANPWHRTLSRDYGWQRTG